MKVNWRNLLWGGKLGNLIDFKNIRPKNQALDVNSDQFYDLLGTNMPSMSASGVMINKETAMKFSAVYGCVSLMAGTIASLPCRVYTDAEGYDQVVPGSRLHPILNRQPNKIMTSLIFWETMCWNLFLAGNAYAIISRTKLGDPKSLTWIPVDSVTPKLNDAKTRLVYQIHLPNRTVQFDQDDVLHLACIGWDGTKGMSIISAATEGIGLGLAGEKFNAHFFTNAVTSDISISYPNKLTPEAREELTKYLQERYSNIENLRKPFIGTDGADIKKLGMSATDAQMIEARDYQVEDICRFFGVPPWMVGAMKKTTSWGTGLGEQVQGFVKFTLRKHLKRIEQEIDRKLIRHPQRFCKFNLDALLRADIKTRNEVYKIALGGNQAPGYMSKNQVRKTEGMPPDPDPASDKLYEPPVKFTADKEPKEDGTDEE